MRIQHWGGRRLLWLILPVALLSGCKTGPCKSPYQVTVPTLQAAPVPLECLQGIQETNCLLVLEQDWKRVVLELKAACIAAGGSFEDCQAQAVEVNNLSVGK